MSEKKKQTGPASLSGRKDAKQIYLLASAERIHTIMPLLKLGATGVSAVWVAAHITDFQYSSYKAQIISIESAGFHEGERFSAKLL